MTMNTIIGIGSVTRSGSGTSVRRFCAVVGLCIGVGMTDGAQSIALCRSLAMDLIALVVVFP